jgi:hypothetical protein
MTTHSTLLDIGFENQGTAGVWQNFFPHSASIKKLAKHCKGQTQCLVLYKVKLLNCLIFMTHANLHEKKECF